MNMGHECVWLRQARPFVSWQWITEDFELKSSTFWTLKLVFELSFHLQPHFLIIRSILIGPTIFVFFSLKTKKKKILTKKYKKKLVTRVPLCKQNYMGPRQMPSTILCCLLSDTESPHLLALLLVLRFFFYNFFFLWGIVNCLESAIMTLNSRYFCFNHLSL